MDYIHIQNLVETVSLNEQLHQSKEQQGRLFPQPVFTEAPERVLNAAGRLVKQQRGPCPSGPMCGGDTEGNGIVT